MEGTDSRYNLYGLDLWYWCQGLELRAEAVRLSRNASGTNPHVWGYYTQAAYRLRHLITNTEGWQGQLGRLEPVVRFGNILESNEFDREQIALGLNYWLFESVPIKFTYEINSGVVDNDRYLIQWAYGF